jgi:hypothetical protein
MFKRLFIEPAGPTTYLLTLLMLVLLAIGAGLWVGVQSVGGGKPAQPRDLGGAPRDGAAKGKQEEVPLNPSAPPLLLMASPKTPEDWNVFLGEVELAAGQGLHRYVVPMRLGWKEPWSAAPLLEQLNEIIKRDPQAMLLLDVDLNPTEEWLSGRPEASVTMPNQTARFASPCSLAWHTHAVQESLYLMEALRDSPLGRHVEGYILSAMLEGSWRFEAGYDTSLASEAAFEKWLVTRHGSPENIAKAWKLDAVPRPLTPPYPNTADSQSVFFKLPEELRYVDYLRFVSESVGDTLARMAAEMREQLGDEVLLLARYGYGLESEHNDSGHFALGNLLNSELDGFITPVSYASRGSGGTGGPMAPIHSGVLRGKVWYLLDDTRTGVSRDPLTGAITRIEGLRAEDVYTVQDRNFGMAVTQGIGLIWADPHAQGWLHDKQQWEKFRKLAGIYCDTWPEFSMTLEEAQESASEEKKEEKKEEEKEEKKETPAAAPVEALLPAAAGGPDKKKASAPVKKAAPNKEEAAETDTPQESEETLEAMPEGEVPLLPLPELPLIPPDPNRLTLQVIVDEESRFYQRYDTPLNNALLLEGRDAALMSGVPCQFVLLEDVLEERTPEASVYLFLNTFRLSIQERERLQQRFAAEQAAVIWVYAPGYFRDEPRTDHITSTARITVEPFSKPERAGSRMAINGRWIRQNETFGFRGVISPLFYINDNNADVIAVFEGSNKPSVAFKTLKEGWTSVLITDAGLTPQLLREILHILEQHLYFQTTNGRYVDTTYFGAGLLSIHARQVGERAVDLGDYYNVTDLLDANLGWPERDSFLIQLDHGETRLMKLDPL